MARYAVDYQGYLYVDADNADLAMDIAYEHLAHLIDDFEIVNVEEGV